MRLESVWRSLIERSRWVWIVLFASVLTVYVLTLAPGALGGDPGELQFVPYILSIPHPTGTPLYILVGKVWSLLPLGPSVAWRMNLLAAVSAALTVIVVYHCVYLRFGHPVPALAASLSLALGLTFWTQATLADKYAFNALMVALVVYFALRWRQTRSSAALHWLALVYGFSLTHHRTMALFAPMLLGYVWWHEKSRLWRDWRRLLRLAVLCLAPLSLYLYLPWAEARGLPPGTWHPRTAREWYDYLFDTGRTGLVYVDPTDLGEMLIFYARTAQRDFTWIGVLLAVGGLAWQWWRYWPDALFLLVSYGLQAFLAANHHVPRHWVYFIPSFLILALWIGECTAGIWLSVEGIGRRKEWWAITSTVLLALVSLSWTVVAVPDRYRPLREAHLGFGVLDPWRQTLKQGHMADRVGRAIAGLESNAVVVCDWEQATPLWYYQQVEGLRPDVQIVYPIERLEEAAARGHSLYIARAHPGLADRWYPTCVGPLITLQPEPGFNLPPGVSPLNVQFGTGSVPRMSILRLAGFSLGMADFRPATVVPLTLYWEAVHSPAHDYSVSLRLLDQDGNQIFQVDSQHPVLGTYPTSGWAEGEVVSDYYEIQLPPGLTPGTYRWAVLLYRALPEGGWESLKAIDTGAEIALGGAFEVRGRGR